MGSVLGSGALPSYDIHSDSSAEAFLDIILRTQQPRLQALLSHPVTIELLRLGKQPVPLASRRNLRTSRVGGPLSDRCGGG